jgi:hypothetical protein
MGARAAIRCLSCLAVLALSGSSFASESLPGANKPENSPQRIQVIRLRYADAADVAELLSHLLPSTFRVAAYRPTNSVVIIAPDVPLQSEQSVHAKTPARH